MAALALLALPAAAQQVNAFPSKSVKLVVPYPPGGGNDVIARSLKAHWEALWGQSVIVENRPGGNGAIGTEAVAKSAGDGYTLLMGSIATHVTSPLLKGKTGKYDPLKDFTPIAMIAATPLILTVHPSVRANNLKELIALARAKPEGISYASVGNGSAGHLAGAMFEQMAGVDLLHVPYKGITQASTDLAGGVVNAAFSNILNVLPLIRAGKLRALGLTGTQTLSILPGVPTIGQTLSGYSADLWWGLFGPAGISNDTVKTIHQATNQYLDTLDARRKWAEDGISLTPMTQADFNLQIAKDTKRWSEVITSRKLTLES
jgi:tripartite-type tricarboxylate transporter receptor subunit TctC